MLKQTITYTDFNEVEHTEDFYFNLTKRELAQMEVESGGTMQARLQAIIDSNDPTAILAQFTDLVERSYGVRSEDGTLFSKTEEATRRFRDSGAMDSLVLQFFTDAEVAVAFANGILPADLVAQAAAKNALDGFRPGADTTRPTPPIQAAAPVDTTPAVAPEVPATVVEPIVAAPVEEPAVPVVFDSNAPVEEASPVAVDPALLAPYNTDPADAASAPSDDSQVAPVEDDAPVEKAPDVDTASPLFAATTDETGVTPTNPDGSPIQQ